MGRTYLIPGFALIFLASCSTPQDQSGHGLADSVRTPFRKLQGRVVAKQQEAVLDARPRYWITALPKSQSTAQTLRPTLKRSVLLAFVPDAEPIVQASGADDSTVVITSVNGQHTLVWDFVFCGSRNRGSADSNPT